MKVNLEKLLTLLDKNERDATCAYKGVQQKHLIQILQHAYNTVPFYKEFYDGRDLENFHGLPVLTRSHVQAAKDNFISTAIPATHGSCYPSETSGTTGRAVRVLATDFTRLFFDALSLREHRWYQRDFTNMLMAILWAKKNFAEAPKGHVQTDWGEPINRYESTGRSVFINIASATQDQIDALLFYEPAYLFTYPSQLIALAEYCLRKQIVMPFLKGIRTTGETFTPENLKLVNEAWPSATVSDVYSCVELGNIAQFCPEYGSYHVNVECVLVEIVDDNNMPSNEGRVLLTGLLNYATPFIRYEIGDYAAWGGQCECGRTLPVLKRILGRKRNRLILPNGESRFPYLGDREEGKKISKGYINKFQFVQHGLYELEYKAVVSQPLSEEQERGLIEFHRRNLGEHFNVKISYHDDIPLSANGKYEEFISHIVPVSN